MVIIDFVASALSGEGGRIRGRSLEKKKIVDEYLTLERGR